MEDSRYYTQGIINKLFHNKRFWKWVFYGILQAFLVFIYSFPTCEYIYNGYLHDLGSQGSIAYSSIVLIANIKILTTTNSHTFISLGFFLFSVLSYYFIVWLITKKSDKAMELSVKIFIPLFALQFVGYFIVCIIDGELKKALRKKEKKDM
jgi:magnesium-transporting ATPase (P-type)